jgi:hypothetical protein
MPWPTTLTPTNEDIGCKNCAEKTLVRKKITVMNWVVMQDVRIVLLSKKQKILQEWEKKNRIYVLTYIYLIYRTILSVNGITLWI